MLQLVIILLKFDKKTVERFMANSHFGMLCLVESVMCQEAECIMPVRRCNQGYMIIKNNTRSRFKVSLLAELMFCYLSGYYKDNAPNGAIFNVFFAFLILRRNNALKDFLKK